jgi:hypothetical protein
MRPHSAPRQLAARRVTVEAQAAPQQVYPPVISARARSGSRWPEVKAGPAELRQPLEAGARRPAQEPPAQRPVLHSLAAQFSEQRQSQAAPWPLPMLTARSAQEAEPGTAWTRRRPAVPRLAASARCVPAAERPRRLARLTASHSGQELAPRRLVARVARWPAPMLMARPASEAEQAAARIRRQLGLRWVLRSGQDSDQ